MTDEHIAARDRMPASKALRRFQGGVSIRIYRFCYSHLIGVQCLRANDE
jgi:hypothetical protein